MRSFVFAWLTGVSILIAMPTMAETTPTRGGILRFSVDAEPANYDCHSNVSFALLHPIAPHYSTLLKFDTAHYPQVTQDLAASWTVSPDKRTYTFKLRPNILFHDGAVLTSADVKASYERIIHPPPGVISVRQIDYTSIAAIETPDPLTVVFRLQWPDPAMQANFASPWNCIYEAARLAADPQYPATHILGTGPFVFERHDKGKDWIAHRWNRYFQSGKPYLDGYEAHFMSGARVVAAMKSGQIHAGFRSFTPIERGDLETALGDRVNVYESPWLTSLLLVFNTKRPPFDDARVRRALSLAIDRWGMAKSMSGTTFLKFVGGLMRPGFAMATPEAALTALPGFSHDIAAARDEARRLLAEAGAENLHFVLVNRDVPIPYGPGAEAAIDAWRAVGVSVTQEKKNTKDWQASLENGQFEVAFDFSSDYFDDPMLQLAKFVSRDLSPSNYTNATDRTLDALYIGQAITADERERARIVRDFERQALTQAYAVPILWWNRIIVTSSRLNGWNMTPSHYIGQDLADVWLSP